MNADLSLFFGRFHPLIVHLPIGILLFAALLELLALVKKSDNLQLAIKVALLTGAVSAALAALSGYSLAGAGGYEAQTLFWHQWMGISIGGVALGTWWLKHRQRQPAAPGKMAGSQWMMLGLLLLIGVTGHLGGNLTHGSTYLTAHMPAPVKLLFAVPEILPSKPALPAHLDSVVAFQHLVQPLLKAKCVSCHNPDKAKGGLDLTSQAAIVKGGKSGPAVVPGDPAASELIKRITLPATSSKFMPANDLPPLSNVEVSLLKWWVATGADFKKNIAAVEADEKQKYLLAVYLGMDPEAVKQQVLPEVPAASPQALEALRKAGMLARQLSEQSNLLDVSFVMTQNVSRQQRQEQLKTLLEVKEQVYWLDVSNCGLHNEDLKMLGQLPNLTKLNLQKNSIGDGGLAYLQGLKKLEYLNVYQNPLSDESIRDLELLPALKKINLWQTQVTEKGVAGLTDARQDLVVDY
jgi:uncharacterized membrane protein